MKNLLVFFLSFMLLWSCNNQPKEENNETDTTVLEETAIEEPDESNEKSEETMLLEGPPADLEQVKIFLQPYMAASRVDSFLNTINKYETIKTDTGLIEFYRNDAEFITTAIYEGMQKSHPDVVYAGDSEPADAWSWINNFLPIKTECLSSEADSEAYKFLPDFLKKAKATNGKLDDDLFKLLNIYYEDYDRTWLTIGYDNAGCDYCGYSTFGSGEHIKLFKEIILVEKKTEYIDKELKTLVASMIDFGGTAFGSSKADILKEIDAFLELKDSTRFDISELETKQTKIANADKSYIFECTYEDFMDN